MKKIYYALFVLLAITSCKKENSGTNFGNGCISQVNGPGKLTGKQNDTTIMLLQNNKLPVDNQVFYQYESYYALDQQNQRAFFQVVSATQLANGLPIFFYDLNYGFENGVLLSGPGKRYGNINLDTKSSLTLQALRQLFLTEASAKDQKPVSFTDSCLVARFGYYNVNISTNDTTVNFIKAWEVHPKNTNFPLGYFRDDNGKLLLFDPLTNGLTP